MPDAKLAELEALMNQAAAGLVMGGDYISTMLHAAPMLIADLREARALLECVPFSRRQMQAERDRLADALERAEAVCAAYEHTKSYEGTGVNRCARDVGGILRYGLKVRP